MIAISGNDLELKDFTIDNLNVEDNIDVDILDNESGLIAFFHVPDASKPELTLFSGTNELTNVYGSVLTVYLEDYQTTEYKYTISTITVTGLY